MESLIHPKFRSGTDKIPKRFFYLIKGKIMMSTTKIPNKMLYKEPFIKYNEDFNFWYASLKKCSVTPSELGCIIGELTMTGNANSVFTGNKAPIEVTNIVEAEYDGHYENIIITFKRRDRGINIILVDEPKPHQSVLYESDKYQGHTLEYWKRNAAENYITTPISVLKYITILEEIVKTKL